jgi:hypothetical protein
MISIAVAQVQIDLTATRIMELKTACNTQPRVESTTAQVRLFVLAIAYRRLVHIASLDQPGEKKIASLQKYIAQLKPVDVDNADPGTTKSQSYYMPTDSVSPDEWSEFENVYQIHCPKVFMDSAIRDVRRRVLPKLHIRIHWT